MSNYSPVFVTLPEPVTLEGLDNLHGFSIFDSFVLLSKDHQEGEVVVLFPVDCEINPVILHNLNLYASKLRNKNPEVKGFFNDQGRVKALKLHGHISTAFATRPNLLAGALGVQFLPKNLDVVNGTWLSREYIPKQTREQQAREKKTLPWYKRLWRKFEFNKPIKGAYKLQPDTPNIRFASSWLHDGTLVNVTAKLHGCNASIGRVKCHSWLPFYNVYRMVYGSRSVIKTFAKNPNHFYKEDVWAAALKPWLTGNTNWPKDTIVYGEIIGHVNGKHIQKGYLYDKLMSPGETLKFIAFKASEIKNGLERVLSYEEFLYLCESQGIPTAPLVASGYYSAVLAEGLEQKYISGNCPWNTNKVPQEGVVISHAERPMNFCKWKSKEFILRESSELSDDTEVVK